MYMFRAFGGIKVKDLYEECKSAIDEGRGEKLVCINDDFEKYTPLCYGFSLIGHPEKIVGEIEDKENVIALG